MAEILHPVQPQPVLVHDGKSSIFPRLKIEKDKWYLGFICPKCGAQILPFIDPTDGKNPPRITEVGTFTVDCYKCKTSRLVFSTSDVKSLKATEDGPMPANLKRAKPSNRPRQPIGSTTYKTANVIFGPHMIEERPDCAVIVARCITVWTYVENSLALLLASLLRIDLKPVVAMFLAIRDSRTQQDALRDAAEQILNASDFALLTATLNIAKSIEKERNSIVHGIFGVAMDIERGVAWMAQQDSVRDTVGIWSDRPRRTAAISSEHFGVRGDIKSKPGIQAPIFVYEPEDLETIAQKIEWLDQFINSLRGYYLISDANVRAERYRQLCAEPLLAQELSRMREGQKKTPGLHTSQHQKGHKRKR